jgi:molecular chaperone HtpG
MVAKKVELWTCKAKGDHAVHWSSEGEGEYSIERLPKARRGTSIKLWLRDTSAQQQADAAAGDEGDDEVLNTDDYSDPWTLRRIVKKYSDFIAFPVVMDQKQWEHERDADGKIVEGGKSEEKITEETLNSGKALWTRQPAAVEAEEYTSFYQHISRDFQEPAETLHFHVEGTQEWTALLFVPSKAPFDLYSREPRRGLQLYIKRVFIAEDVKELIPEHFRFIKGLIDSSDLPLNVSRETVQQDRQVPLIRKRVATKLLNHFKDLLEKDRSKYEQLWNEFGACIKEGFHYEPGQKDKLAEIVLVRTTHGTGWSTLAEVAARKQEGQTALYYLTGDKLDVLQHAPQLEVFRKRNVEVILLPDAVDEILAGALDKFGDLELKSAAKGELDGLAESAESEEKKKAQAGEFAPLVEQLQGLLSERVASVRVSERLTDSAVCLVADKDGMSSQVERMLAAMGQPVPQQKRVLEINADHGLIRALRDLAGREGGAAKMGEYAEMLLDQALLAEGASLANPAQFAQRVASVMAGAIGAAG